MADLGENLFSLAFSLGDSLQIASLSFMKMLTIVVLSGISTRPEQALHMCGSYTQSCCDCLHGFGGCCRVPKTSLFTYVHRYPSYLASYEGERAVFEGRRRGRYRRYRFQKTINGSRLEN